MDKRIEEKFERLCKLNTIPSHMISGIKNYVLYGEKQGDFLQAVFSNDLFGAYGRADMYNKEALEHYVTLIYNYLPSSCFGNRKAVEEWSELGGLVGVYRNNNRHKTDEEIEQDIENNIDAHITILVN